MGCSVSKLDEGDALSPHRNSSESGRSINQTSERSFPSTTQTSQINKSDVVKQEAPSPTVSNNGNAKAESRVDRDEPAGGNIQSTVDKIDPLDPTETPTTSTSPSVGNGENMDETGPAIPPQSAAPMTDIPMIRRARSDVPQPDSSTGIPFEDLYELKNVLGTGAFSTVREGFHKDNPENSYAIKCVTRAKLSDEDAVALLDEVAILRELKHKHIIRIYDFFQDPTHFFLIMEKMTGGELFDRIVAKAYYNEKEARDVCKILLEAVGYCHQMGVAHRDLKPENLLLVSEESDSDVKLADFGFAKKVYSPRSLTTQCGTPGYVAPEILSGVPYDTRADMWSVGVILYILLGGYPPFIDNNQRELFRKIRKGDYEFHDEYWGTVSSESKDLIRSLLTVDPGKRLSAEEALQNRWILRDDDELATHDLGANLEALKLFNAKRKFKAAVSTVLAVNKLQSLGKEFMPDLD